MSNNLVLLISGAFSSFAVGWAIGRSVKAVRQFFDHVS